MDESRSAITREELHELVWTTPMVHLAERFGLSGNGLAKICRRLDVPYPPRGWWAKKAAGKATRSALLPKLKPGVPTAVQIIQREREVETSSPELRGLREQVGEIAVPDRLARAHPVIAVWKADRQRQRREAAREGDPWMRRALSVPDFTEMEKRGHRALHALLRALERAGATVADGHKRGRVEITVEGQGIELEIREKLKQVKRPMNDDEKRWRSDTTRQVTELVGTGRLHVVVHTWSTGGFKREWLESDRQPIEEILPEVAATLLAMGPHLAENRRQREEDARLAEERRRRAEEERRLKKRDDNRWRRFLEHAERAEQARKAQALIAALRGSAGAADSVEGQSISEWLDWAEARANAADPLASGSERLFADVAQVHEWTYRD